ncbi:NUDIX domain-containing protein [Candidatus Marsarchaeota archaeon]|jgi:8-oxo-dGTP pyrophosphatase MutT (NUDIX family)|nr:NUDIX domain-containing protein [Candidatus Marsarchaeota archaeon]MCL5092440.1 NUDIX domain-containing protein [Candidatus Marsarchaeota archaeon]
MKRCIVAGSIIFNAPKDEVLLIKHKKLGVWLPPGGHVEAGEFPYEAAVREAKEETGLDIELLGSRAFDYSNDEAATLVKPFATIYENVPYKDERHIHFDMVYLATSKSGEISLNRDESDGIRWFSYNDVKNINTFENVRVCLMSAMKEQTV